MTKNSHSLGSAALSSFYESRGFGGRVGFGGSPAILVIDLARAWTDPGAPLGADLQDVIGQTRQILDAGRVAGVPIFFTVMAFEPNFADRGEVIARKVGHRPTQVKGTAWVELEPSLERQPTEVLITKQRASAFFGTSLLSQLIGQGIDTVIITGCSTSGCIRATAQDSHDMNFHTIVAREAVGDRSSSAHEANLFDIDARLADVVDVSEVIEYLQKRGTGRRKSPRSPR